MIPRWLYHGSWYGLLAGSCLGAWLTQDPAWLAWMVVGTMILVQLEEELHVKPTKKQLRKQKIRELEKELGFEHWDLYPREPMPDSKETQVVNEIFSGPHEVKETELHITTRGLDYHSHKKIEKYIQEKLDQPRLGRGE